jgi:3-methyl-2-oxobutanoate hydroxymethyltransferase
MKKVTILDLGAMKAEGRRIVMVTAYDALFAQIFDEADVDVILVGDSPGHGRPRPPRQPSA